MPIPVKSESQIAKMRKAGKIVRDTHELLEQYIKVGITTKELDTIAEEFILSKNAKPSFKGYNGFPAAACISVNDEVIHGIPGKRKLKEGDIVSIDIGAFIDGFHGDAARTHPVGKVSDEAKRLIDVTRTSFFEGMRFARTGHRLFDISEAIYDYAVQNGFSIVREYCGHGVGKDLHEEPQIPNYKEKIRGPRLSKGMVLAIEPMVNMGTEKIRVLSDNWTVVTMDGKYSAHYENTVLITDGDPELLTF